MRARLSIILRPADIAWICLLIYVVGWDVTCKDGATLSEAMDSYLERHPWLTRAVVVVTACHLINAYPSWADPWSWGIVARRVVRRRRMNRFTDAIAQSRLIPP